MASTNRQLCSTAVTRTNCGVTALAPRRLCMLVKSGLRGSLFGSRCLRSSSAAGRCRLLLGPRSGVCSAECPSVHSSQGDESFSTWLTANPLPEQGQHAVEPDRRDVPHTQDVSNTTSRRFHHSDAAALITELHRRYSDVQWSSARKAFIFTGNEAALVPEEGAAPRVPVHGLEILPPRGRPWVSLQLPLVLGKSASVSLADGAALLRHVADGKVRAGRLLVALLSADSAALALWHNGQLLQHKTLTGYTIRKQQGSSQLKHLRSGAGASSMSDLYVAQRTLYLSVRACPNPTAGLTGKQSTGGSLRSRETKRFFRSVANKLKEW